MKDIQQKLSLVAESSRTDSFYWGQRSKEQDDSCTLRAGAPCWPWKRIAGTSWPECRLNSVTALLSNLCHLICFLLPACIPEWCCSVPIVISAFPRCQTQFCRLDPIIFLPVFWEPVGLSVPCALNLAAILLFCISDSHSCNSPPPHPHLTWMPQLSLHLWCVSPWLPASSLQGSCHASYH